MSIWRFLDDNLVPILVIGFLSLMVGGFLGLAWQDTNVRQERALACISAGKSYVSGSCVPAEAVPFVK